MERFTVSMNSSDIDFFERISLLSAEVAGAWSRKRCNQRAYIGGYIGYNCKCRL